MLDVFTKRAHISRRSWETEHPKCWDIGCVRESLKLSYPLHCVLVVYMTWISCTKRQQILSHWLASGHALIDKGIDAGKTRCCWHCLVTCHLQWREATDAFIRGWNMGRGPPCPLWLGRGRKTFILDLYAYMFDVMMCQLLSESFKPLWRGVPVFCNCIL